MIKALSAIAIAAFIAAALSVLPGFAPQVEASVPQVLAKGDRLDIRTIGRDCAQQAWPNFKASCLRSGLPITETLGIVAGEIPGPVGVEFRMVSDKMKIGRTMEAALQDTADRMGTAEFQFFVITLAIQRETGGNLAETLSNLSDVLRKRAQMKLKIRAMSSESKASAYIVGSLPFVVFGLVMMINPHYMQGFFSDQRLEVAGIGGMIWMGIGVLIMAKMVNFEI